MPNRLKVPYNKKTDSVKLITVRFAPEPSGYLHIGHAKPLILNDTIRNDFNGKYIVRFDDTNPKKESIDFETAIMADINTLGIRVDTITHTSDYFDILLEYARRLVTDGYAYMDDTPDHVMKQQRFNREPSNRRSNDITFNLDTFNIFINDSESCWCLRAKISYDNNNACLRDPVIVRSCNVPHIKYGTKYKVYPTYDFCCPIVDHIEGITHALRANEYLAHYDIYKWLAKKLELNDTYVIHFAKISFEQTVMSKRYLKHMVDTGLVDGWDDPRLPTIRGLAKRGLHPDALNKYIVGMGMNNKITLPSWDMLWATNKKMIDQVIPRYSSVDFNILDHSIMHIVNGPTDIIEYDCELHQNNKSLGTKKAYKWNKLLVNKYDSNIFEIGDRVGLLRNVVVDILDVSDKSNIQCKISDDQNFSITKFKINWLVNDPSKMKQYRLISYDYLINTKTLEKGDNIEEIFNKDSKKESIVYIESALEHGLVKIGDSVQLERRGYYVYSGIDYLVQTPEGRQKSMIN